jgi:hypothetical protein
MKKLSFFAVLARNTAIFQHFFVELIHKAEKLTIPVDWLAANGNFSSVLLQNQ